MVVSSATGIFWKVPPRPSPSLRRYIQVLIRDIHLIKKSLSGEFRNRGGDFGMTLILATKGRQRRASASLSNHRSLHVAVTPHGALPQLG
ncbi:Uncharacterised protein [Mycobacterium tuberculosis]|uniref:Uncharacterized protein n=2 Tax=Mycobacterium tuberculosis TaxID=1773 RepID=A0A654TJY1_MYCTX|nr:Uncharacterised protein [Mycobacterium tuberculosis]CKU30021.1 Uncharacterised protein [Mycobacterium tuberculosis]COY12792.1 Uncharacterised protein [Mycobacterium tuberculosis]CPA77480.1 Uncharacterised protein [Mycobacterium tuberculosis]